MWHKEVNLKCPIPCNTHTKKYVNFIIVLFAPREVWEQLAKCKLTVYIQFIYIVQMCKDVKNKILQFHKIFHDFDRIN